MLSLCLVIQHRMRVTPFGFCLRVIVNEKSWKDNILSCIHLCAIVNLSMLSIDIYWKKSLYEIKTWLEKSVVFIVLIKTPTSVQHVCNFQGLRSISSSIREDLESFFKQICEPVLLNPTVCIQVFLTLIIYYSLNIDEKAVQLFLLLLKLPSF